MNFKIGDLVKYSKQLAQATGDTKRKGVVVEIGDQVRPNGPFYLKVQWIGIQGQNGVLSCNVQKVRG